MLSEYANVPVDKIQNLIGVLTNTSGPASGSIMKWWHCYGRSLCCK